MSYNYLPENEEDYNLPTHTSTLTTNTVKNISNSMKQLLTTTSLNQVFSSRYRKQSLIALLTYFIIGILYYTLQQNLTFLNALYYIVITILTIG